MPPKITTQVLQEVTTTLPIYAIDVKYPMAPPEGIHVGVGYDPTCVEIGQPLPHQTALLVG